MSLLYIAADNTVTLTGLSAGGGYLNSATVTYALKDAAGTAVSGGTGTLSYVAASNGNYSGTIESTVATAAALSAGSTYYIEVTISSGSYNDFRRFQVRAVYRGGT